MFYMQIYDKDALKQGTLIGFSKEIHIFRDNLRLFSFFLEKKVWIYRLFPYLCIVVNLELFKIKRV